jgi:hypothetical protein
LEATAHCIFIFVRVVVVLWMMANEIGEKRVVVAMPFWNSKVVGNMSIVFVSSDK